jgi:hypothetical protein
MATKNRRAAPGRQPKGGVAEPVPPQPTPAQQTSSQPNQPSGARVDASQPATGTIKKGVYLSALIYVEGNQAPAEDFNSLSISVLKKNLNEFFATPHDGLTITLKSVDVRNDVEADDGESGSAGGSKKREKFQF